VALQYQSVPVNFSGGLDQKTAEQLVVPGKFLVLENCVRRKLGKIQKRYGFTNLSRNIVGGGNIVSGSLLSKLNNDIVQVSGDKIYSYLPSTDQWVDKGDISSITTTSSPIIRNSDTQTLPDICSYKGIVVSVWEDSRGGIRASVFDEATGAAILSDTQVSATGVRPKVVGVANRFLIVYIVGTTLNCKTIEVAVPTALTAEVEIDSVVVNAAFDLIAWSTNYAMIAYRNTSSEIILSYLTVDGILGGSSVALPAPAAITYPAGVVLTLERAPDVDLVYLVASDTSGTNTDAWVFTSSLLFSDTVSVNSTNCTNATIAVRGGNLIDVYMEFENTTDPHLTFTEKAVLTFDGTTLSVDTASVTFKRTVGLASKAFISDNVSYVVTQHESPLQSTYFLVRSDGFIASRNFAGLAGGFASKSGLPRVTGSFLTSLTVRNSFAADGDTFVLSSNSGIARLDLGIDSSTYNNRQLGQNLHMAGGLLLNYDGDTVTEHGFNLYPENVVLTPNGAGPGSPWDNGFYYYRVTYEWIDAKGQIHQSAPSIQVGVDMTSDALNQVVITVPTLQMTAKTGTRSAIRVVLWRGLTGDDQVLYRLMDTPNIVGTDTVTLTDQNGSAFNNTLRTRQVLYTTGGVIENIAPPSCSTITLHKNRLFLGGLDETGYIAYSKEFVTGEGVAFSDFFTIPVDPASGNVTTLASMDDKLVIFKKDAIYTLVGDGPLDTGAQNNFSLPQFVSGDLGCENPRSVASINDGILFKSDKGMYLLTRDLQTIYVGQGVENFNNLTISSAVVLEDVNEVRFTTSDGIALIFNYEFNQWSTFSNYEAVSAINGLGSYLHLKSDGTVRKESSAYLDAGAKIKMAIETSWLAFAGIQGYQRIRSWMLLGDFLTDHYTKVKLYYDYEKFASETVYFNVDNGLELSYYGDDVTYGDSVVYGGTGSGVFQFTSQPRIQKCQSMKMRIEDIDTKVAGGGGSFNLVGLSLEVGSKQTLTKQLRGNKSVGS
jgi:hypothetical protein